MAYNSTGRYLEDIKFVMTLSSIVRNYGAILYSLRDSDLLVDKRKIFIANEGYRSFTKFRLRMLVILLFYFITASVHSC